MKVDPQLTCYYIIRDQIAALEAAIGEGNQVFKHGDIISMLFNAVIQIHLTFEEHQNEQVH
jgi:hypothetical protein